MIIKNLSQLKKALVPGVEFEILLHYRPECIGQIRRITKSNTTGFYSAIVSKHGNQANTGNNGLGLYLEWGPAKIWTFDAEGICAQYTDYKDGRNNEIIIAFKILEVQNEDVIF